MRERGFSLRKRAPATFHRDAADDSLRLVLQGRASRGRWHVWVGVRVALLDVERWCRARGLESRGCELHWVVSQEVLRAAMPRPSSLAWANGLDLVDATGDVPSRSELESRGKTVSDFLHSEERLSDAASTLLRVLDEHGARCLDTTRDGTLVRWLEEPTLVALREHLPGWSREGAMLVAIACVRAPELAETVAANLRAQAVALDPAVEAALCASLDAITRARKSASS